MDRAAWIISCAAWPLLLTAGACIEKGPKQKKIDPAYIQANLVTELPDELNKVGATLGSGIEYVGNTVDSESLVPGGSVKVVHYWRVVTAPGSGFRVFSHLNGSGGRWINVDHSDMRVGYPPDKWKAGDLIRDEHSFTLPEDWASPYAQLTVGLYELGAAGVDGRMEVTKGPKDNERRVRAYRFKVSGASAKPTKAKVYNIRRASGPITIDGKGDEPAWKSAAWGSAFAPAEGGSKMTGSAKARLLWDDDHLYGLIEVADNDVFSPFKNRDDPLWKADVVEFFIDADGNRRGYVELQINPNNAHFDAWFPATRAQKHHFEWNSTMRSAVVVDGTADSRDDTDKGWTVEVAIPIADVKGMDQKMRINVPPKVGDRWRLNIVRVEVPKGGRLSASSWNPITIRDFHALGRMLTVVFADDSGATRPAPLPTPAPLPAPAKPGETPAGGATAPTKPAVNK